MSGKEKGFGTYLRSLRLEKKLSLRQLAQEADIDFTYLSKVETGRFPPPSEEVIERLARALGTDSDELLRLARKVDTDIHEFIVSKREAPALLRAWKDGRVEEARRILNGESTQGKEDVQET